MADNPPGTIDASQADPEQRPSDRRFQLWDAMVLIAAIGVGLVFGKKGFSESYPKRLILRGFHLHYAIYYGCAAVAPGLLALSIAYFPIRLQRPRPSLVQIMIQPGCVASVTSTVSVLGLVAMFIGETKLSVLAEYLPIHVGMGIALQWFLLWSSGWWKPEPSWIDRMGRLLGLCWIAMPCVLASSFWL